MGDSLSAICVGCTNKKNAIPSSFLSQVTLQVGKQAAVADEWVSRLRRNPKRHLMAGADLYGGRGVVRAHRLADTLATPLFVISAGLGLVRGDSLVPAYDLTVAKVPGAIGDRVIGQFSASSWWDAMLDGPYSAPISALTRGHGRIVIALSRSYAAMVGPWLATLPSTVRGRLRILGASLDLDLPPSLVPQWIRHDESLDILVPGIKLHYATRAMEHFLAVCGRLPMADVAADRARVTEALGEIPRMMRNPRRRLDDKVLEPMVAQAMESCGSIARALEHLRKVDGVACSDQRFRTLMQGIYA